MSYKEEKLIIEEISYSAHHKVNTMLVYRSTLFMTSDIGEPLKAGDKIIVFPAKIWLNAESCNIDNPCTVEFDNKNWVVFKDNHGFSCALHRMDYNFIAYNEANKLMKETLNRYEAKKAKELKIITSNHKKQIKALKKI